MRKRLRGRWRRPCSRGARRIPGGPGSARPHLGPADGEHINALEELEYPAHGGPGAGLAGLGPQGLVGGRQLGAQVVFGLAIDEQAEHHDVAQGHDTAGFLEEGILPPSTWVALTHETSATLPELLPSLRLGPM